MPRKGWPKGETDAHRRMRLIASVRQYYAVADAARTVTDRAAYARLKREDPALAEELDRIYREGRGNA